jgi:hypothetical protein
VSNFLYGTHFDLTLILIISFDTAIFDGLYRCIYFQSMHAILRLHACMGVNELTGSKLYYTLLHYNISLATNHDYRALCLGPLRIIDRPTMASATYEDGNGQ